ncbi:catalase [Edaphobacillus lindanitolerans]|uniref:Catalase n=1 Tax=Edaphobacillus lindanitolerans TaxID=550447 RepID=A0A1U7PTT4_9BACI|nr:catalase [Edaphobacillus lindanitolerans]SIT93026.1 catalase [Edaphobacillus lindanitolerans]
MDHDKQDNQMHQNKKDRQLDQFRRQNTGNPMTDINGQKVANDQKTLRAGKRGPLLMQDFHFYKKQSHFNRERIPEKVVHARGFGVHGVFEATESLEEYTMAKFLEPGTKTPVFVRFSNFIGNRGSKDTAVDIRGFATKFYTEQGNYDMLALQFPVFILADAMKFMDVTHAAKPEPRQHMPQATVAHDNFWDYVVSNPESAHMVMWVMSMRGRPRSWRMMEGYPINTFRFINKEGKSTFVRFIWKPKLGVHSLMLDEANIIGGVDPDFHRRDIVEAIGNGAFPEYELCVQLIDEEDEFKFDFDILDDTKFWPEEEVPPKVVGKMTLNRLMDNFFAENEQSAFNPSNLVPGIEFTNDPVLQGRSFAYRDTELHRHHSANYEELPINRPISDVNHNLRDSYLKYPIEQDSVHFHNNMQAENTPAEVSPEEGGYENYPGQVEGHVTREHPSESFQDYYSQARMFWNSLSMPEKQDLVDSFSFHVGSVKNKDIRQKTVEMFGNVDTDFATMLAENIGVEPPQTAHVDYEKSSSALSQLNTPHSAWTSRVAVLIGDEFNGEELKKVLDALAGVKAKVDIVSETLAPVKGSDGLELTPTQTFLTVHPTLYDSIFVAGGKAKNQMKFDQAVMDFFKMQYMHMKPIAVSADAEQYVLQTEDNNMEGVVLASANPEFARQYVDALAIKRFWDRT